MSGGGCGILAREVVRQCLRCGVREVVVCAGARNAMLVAAFTRTPSLRVWSFPEERCAGFFALGRARASGGPVAVVTTSGTAAAELLPAAIEAHYQRVPLVLITADRPLRFRGTGAPQAIDQLGLFGGYVTACCDLSGKTAVGPLATAMAVWSRTRPIHLNVCFEEPRGEELADIPQLDAEEVVAAPDPEPAVGGGKDRARIETFLAGEGALVAIIAGLPRSEQAPVARFLQRLGAPVMAEAVSGLREHPALSSLLVRGGEAGLATLSASRVLRIGGVPSLRFWRDLDERGEVAVFSVTREGFGGLARSGEVVGFPDWDAVRLDPVRAPEMSEDREIAGRLEATLSAFPRSEPALVRALSAAVPTGSMVFLGNSLPVREWNAFAGHEPRELRCLANRGANGIDGCVSTFLGLSAGEEESWCLIGDLTAVYDLAALWIGPALPRARRRIVVINNGGGRIFRRMEPLRRLDETARMMMENPHRLEFRGWAELWGWTYRRVTRPDDLASPIAADHIIIEIGPDPAQTEAAWNSISSGPLPSSDFNSPHLR